MTFNKYANISALSAEITSFRGTLPNPSETIVDPKPRKFIATKNPAVSCRRNRTKISRFLDHNLSSSVEFEKSREYLALPNRTCLLLLE